MTIDSYSPDSSDPGLYPRATLREVLFHAPQASLGRGGGGSRNVASGCIVPVLVAGTTTVTNSLYGDWKVEAFLDGERDTLARTLFRSS